MNTKNIMIRKIAIILTCIVIWIGFSIYEHIKKSSPKDDSDITMEETEKPQEITSYNVRVTRSSETSIEVFLDGNYMTFEGRFESIVAVNSLADITYVDNKLLNVRVKNERIYGKILSIKENSIEIEGYGEVPINENMRIFKTIGELTQLSTAELQVGYEGGEFYVGEGEICGVIVNTVYSNEIIRVLIKTDGFEELYHPVVTLDVNSDFVISYGDTQEIHSSGEVLTINGDSPYFVNNRMKILPSSNSGETKITSVTRAYGNPSYLGSIEIERRPEGLIIVNELPLEQYLYSVVPSEMPTSYGMEAVKAQAICARSYAIKHMEGGSYAQYGAHVNDSVQFQVYNNSQRDALSVQAVDETAGQVVLYDGAVANTFYFSTSCGHTSTNAIWGDKGGVLPYLKSILLNASGDTYDLSNNDTFRAFITSVEPETYEKEEAWYRWQTTTSLSNIAAAVNANITSRIKANPGNILVEDENGEFVEKTIDSIGDVLNVSVEKRSESGVVEILQIIGTLYTIQVTSEYNIRALLFSGLSEITKNDGSTATNLSLLPSAYIYIEPMKEGEILTGYTIFGGGYGHGVGMSQNGANNMAHAGMTYDEILHFYYKEIEISNIYE